MSCSANPWRPVSAPIAGPIELKPGEVVLIGSLSLSSGLEGGSLEKLSELVPEVLQLTLGIGEPGEPARQRTHRAP